MKFKKKRKNLKIIIVTSCFVLVVMFLTNLEKISSSRYNSNDIVLLIESKNIDESKIDIIQNIWGDKRYIFKDGIMQSSYASNYGKSCFSFFYDNTLINKMCYFKENHHHMNKHIFILVHDSLNNNIKMELILEGPDEGKVYYPAPASL